MKDGTPRGEHKGAAAPAPDLRVKVGGLELKNPLMTASGTFGYGAEFAPYLDLNRLGGVVVKGISREPKEGNRPPRIVETAAGMLNSIGLQNVGVECFIAEKMPFLRRFDTAVIVNFFGDSIEEYCEVASMLSDVEGVAALEMNISCPNKQEGWLEFGTRPDLTCKVTSAVRKVTSLPLIVKLSPNVTDITEIARAAEDGGADILSLINTLSGIAVDVETRRPMLANVVGGLSGPAIKPVALKMVWQLSGKTNLPLIGIGGIMTAEDALEFLIVGASAVQVGTANFRNPSVAMEVIDGMEDFFLKHRLAGVGEIVGTFDTTPLS